MDRQRINELPSMQVQFFETTGLPVFKVRNILPQFFYSYEVIGIKLLTCGAILLEQLS